MRVAVLCLVVMLMAIAGCGAGTDDHQVAPPPAGTFVTIMVTESGGYGHPSTAATAARWAARFGLIGVEPRFFRETAV